MKNTTRIATFLAALTLLACQKDEIRTYKIPKERPPSSSPQMPLDAIHQKPHASRGDTHREVDWKTPPGWIEQEPSSMRVGSFLVKGDNGLQADISIIPLEGEAGSDLSNINRWRGQIGLGPVQESDLKNDGQTITPQGRNMFFIDYPHQGKSVIAAIYRQDARTWFFKMMGDTVVAQSAKPAFMELLKSLSFHEHE